MVISIFTDMYMKGYLTDGQRTEIKKQFDLASVSHPDSIEPIVAKYLKVQLIKSILDVTHTNKRDMANHLFKQQLRLYISDKITEADGYKVDQWYDMISVKREIQKKNGLEKKTDKLVVRKSDIIEGKFKDYLDNLYDWKILDLIDIFLELIPCMFKRKNEEYLKIVGGNMEYFNFRYKLHSELVMSDNVLYPIQK